MVMTAKRAACTMTMTALLALLPLPVQTSIQNPSAQQKQELENSGQ